MKLKFKIKKKLITDGYLIEISSNSEFYAFSQGHEMWYKTKPQLSTFGLPPLKHSVVYFNGDLIKYTWMVWFKNTFNYEI